MTSEDECIFSRVEDQYSWFLGGQDQDYVPVLIGSFTPFNWNEIYQLWSGNNFPLKRPSLREAVKKSIGPIRLGKTVGGSFLLILIWFT